MLSSMLKEHQLKQIKKREEIGLISIYFYIYFQFVSIYYKTFTYIYTFIYIFYYRTKA